MVRDTQDRGAHKRLRRIRPGDHAVVEEHDAVEARLLIELHGVELAGTDARVAAVDPLIVCERGHQHRIAAPDALARGVVDARARTAMRDGIDLRERQRRAGDCNVRRHAGSE